MSEQRTRYHIEAKMSATGAPMILSANVTRGLGRKTSFSASVKNVFRETASVSGIKHTLIEETFVTNSTTYLIVGLLV